ncbi:MAG: NADH dehydrogenase [Peptococcaceae bacterium BICA1-7]|nr:MAG: NADH dehydrogenase [Peptococcaceae bacterium BICA1-7]
MDLIRIKIDGRDVEVPAGTTVLEAAEQAGIHIPRLCHDPELSRFGACRLCVVEIEGMRNLPASCVTAVASGMVVWTESPPVTEARKTILELLMANHPQDCLTCEKMGDCRLADYCYRYGVKEIPYKGKTHAYGVEEDNPFIVRDADKCILCGKCVRACAEITGKDNLDFAYRGFDTKVATFGDSPLLESDCVFCGSCVAVCPTGALMEKQMQGRARRYELKRVKTTCPFCGTGCNFELCVKEGKIMGVTTKSGGAVNGRSLCIKGRFGWDFVYSEKRLDTPYIKKNGKMEPATWDEALNVIAGRLGEIKQKYGPGAFAALSSARCTNEENYLVQKLVRVVMGTNNVDHCART